MSHTGKLSYKVYFQPLTNADDNEYADEVEVTDRVLYTGVGDIRASIDAADYDVGVFTFSDLELKGSNFDGFFNENDARSMFPSIRDRCKVRVVFRRNILTRTSSGTITDDTETDTVTFRGVINDEATRIDIAKEQIRFKVLSRDSVLRTTRISSGVVSNTDLFSEAMLQILNVPRITSVLNVDEDNINPDLDLEIDDGTWFDNKTVKEALDRLLFAANSCLLINDDGDVIIKSRDYDDTQDVLRLYGQYDVHKRENIISLEAYNPGTHRTFTSIEVNDTQETDETMATAFGLRIKRYQLGFITDADKESQIAERVVDEFKVPKAELEVTVPTDLVRDVPILAPVSINYPLRLEPYPGTFLPVVGVTQIGDTDQKLPLQFGSFSINPRIGFKIIEISHNAQKFTSKLKLRQFGTTLDDGFYDTPFSSILGFAILGLAPIDGESVPCDTYNPSVLGAARLGCTETA